jgi:hypothetical protein
MKTRSPLAKALRLLADSSDAQAEAMRGHAEALRALAEAVQGDTSEEPAVVTSRGAASFGISPRKFRALVRAGDIPGSNDGRYSATVEAVRAYVDRHTVAPKAARGVPRPGRARHASGDGVDVDAEIDRLLEGGRLRPVETNRPPK